MVIWLRLAALTAAAAAPLTAQTLTLADALGRADRAAYANRMASGTARADAARADGALRGILPSLRLEGGWVRSNDPLAVFAADLHQRTVTAADFDPARLNRPAPLGDVAAGAVLELPLVNADAWTGRRAASRAADAAAAGARWTRERTRAEVVRAYYGALLAAEKVATLEAAVRAARDHVRAAGSLARAGMALRSDVLLATVKAGELSAELAGARADAVMARAGLTLLLGAPADTAFALPAALPSAGRVRALATPDTAGIRADLEAAALGVEAAEADRRRARTTLLPRVNAFARYDYHDATRPFGGTPMWTAGLMASWSLFSGGAELAEGRAASARLDVARTAAEAAAAQARLEVARRAADLAVARERLDIADSAVAQAEEAHRLVRRKYDGGLANVVELLEAAAAETMVRLRHAAARYDLIAAIAAQRLATGRPLEPLTILD